MQLISTACLWLECCNCGAVYEDIWSNIQKEIPVCPYCGWSWYINTENYKAHGPNKKHYRKTSPSKISTNLSSRWERYKKLIAYSETLPVDERIAHEIAWQQSVNKKINLIYFTQIIITRTLERVLSWRGCIDYKEMAWPDDIDNILWEEINIKGRDVTQNTERQALALLTLKEILEIWHNTVNSDLDLWKAVALRSPGKNATIRERRFYTKVKVQLLRFRRKLVKKLGVLGFTK